MEYALIALLSAGIIYLTLSRRAIERHSAEEYERLDLINDNLRQYIQELEQDLDKVCRDNQENERFIELVKGSRIVRIIRDLKSDKPLAKKVIMNAYDYSELARDCFDYKITDYAKIPNRIYNLEIKIADVASVRVV